MCNICSITRFVVILNLLLQDFKIELDEASEAKDFDDPFYNRDFQWYTTTLW